MLGVLGLQAVRAVHHAGAAEERLWRAGGGDGIQVSGGGAARALPLPGSLRQVTFMLMAAPASAASLDSCSANFAM